MSEPAPLTVQEKYVLRVALDEFAEGELEAADDYLAQGRAEEHAALVDNAQVAKRLVGRLLDA